MSQTDQDAALQKAEKAIQEILLDLENEHGIAIDSISVDTRNFANLAVTIVPVRPNVARRNT